MIVRPRACPACKARIERAHPPEHAIGRAKTLLMVLVGAPQYRKLYRTPEVFLEEDCIEEAEVDRLVSLAQAMDYDAWEQHHREGCTPGRPLTLTQQEFFQFLPMLREMARSGDMVERLRAAGESARANPPRDQGAAPRDLRGGAEVLTTAGC